MPAELLQGLLVFLSLQHLLFLGLGSMWFHASLMAWGGNMDGLSMYAYAAFLPLYTLRRRFVPAPAFFWFAYPATVGVFLLLHMLLSPIFGLTSLVLILILVAALVSAETRMGCWIDGRTRSLSDCAHISHRD